MQNAKAASRFLFVTKVANNQLSWNQVRFKNGEIYEISSKSIRGKRVSLFLWNESTEYLWFVKDERRKIMVWLETASSVDIFAFANSVVEKTGSGKKPCPPDWGTLLNRDLISKEIENLDLLHLREFTAMIYAGRSEVQAA